MGTLRQHIVYLICLLVVTICHAIPPTYMYEDQIAEESIDDEHYFTSYASLPKNIFNDGKPFIVGKDPVTGQIDFNSKKIISSSTTSNNLFEKQPEIKKPSDINQIAPNIHDFLNLPVKYSSSKSVYPLISSSYSNLKYQGNNKHFVSNHKELTTQTTTSPKYYTNTMIVKSTSVKEPEVKITKRPIVSTSSIAPFTIRSTISSSTSTTTTQSPIPKLSLTQKPFSISSTTSKYNTKKYQDSSSIRKKITISSTISPKVEAKKNNTFMLHTQLNVIPLTKTTKYPLTNLTTPTTISSSSSTTNNIVRFPGVSDPTKPSRPITMRPTSQITKSTTLPPKTKIPNLSDLFSLWSEDEYYDEHTEKSQFDSNKLENVKPTSLNFIEAPNSMLPNNYQKEHGALETTKFGFPSTSFATPKSTIIVSTTPTTIKTSSSTTPFTPTANIKLIDMSTVTTLPTPQPTRPHQTMAPPPSFQDKHDLQPTQTIKEQNYVNFGGMTSIPSRNTFVMSPGQDSASIVLGSQQSFGTEGHFVGAGSAIKETPYENNLKRFHGTVINEINHQDTIPQGFSIKVQPQPDLRFPIDVSKPNSKPVSFDDPPIVHGTIKKDHPLIPDSGVSMALEQDKHKDNSVQFPNSNKNLTPQQMNIELIKAIDEQLASESGPNQVIFKEEQSFGLPNIQPPSQDLTPPGDGQYEAPQFFERPANGQGLPPPYIYGDLQRHDQRRPPPSQHKQHQMHHGQMQHMQGQPQFPQQQRLPMNDRQQQGGNHGKQPSRPMPQSQMGPQYRLDRVPPPSNRPQAIPDRMLMQDRPEAGQPLPNILPQFRPNAKVSHGHGGHKKEAGTIKVNENSFKNGPPFPNHPENYPPPRPEYFQSKPPSNNRRRPPPTFMLRRTPGPNRFVSRISHPYSYSEELNLNRRHYYPGPPVPDRMLSMGPPNPIPPHKYLDSAHPVFQRNMNINGKPMNQHEPQPLSGEQEFLNRNSQNIQLFHQENQVPPIVQKSTTERPFQDLNMKVGKLEPVVTLQMLQAKKMAMIDQEKNVEVPLLKENIAEMPVTIETAKDNKPVYVVYPIREDATLEDVEPSRSSGVPTGSEYQNTPFSVVSHFEQEPILMLKEKVKPTKSAHFPYPIEKPNFPGEIEPHHIRKGQLNDFGIPVGPIFNTGEQPLPNFNSNINNNKKGQVISTTLTRVTTTPQHTTGSPIAIAYTPSPRPINAQGPHIYDSNSHEMYSMPNIITHEAQTEQSYFHDYDYDHRIKETFQAPFYASANVPNKVTQVNKFEGWAIATPEPIPQFNPHYDNNQIDRSDTNVLETETESLQTQPIEMTTKKFDPNNFQPEFLTGFQPIYTSDSDVKQSTRLEPAPRDGALLIELSTEHLRPEVKHGLQTEITDNSYKAQNDKTINTNHKIVSEDDKSNDNNIKNQKKPVKEIDSLQAFFDALVNYDDNEYTKTDENITSRSDKNIIVTPEN